MNSTEYIDSNRQPNGLVSISYAAQVLGVSIDTVRRWDNAGKLASVRADGRNRYFNYDDVLAYKASQPLSTADVAAAYGVSASTVRRMEEQGILVSTRDANGRRMYPAAAVHSQLISVPDNNPVEPPVGSTSSRKLPTSKRQTYVGAGSLTAMFLLLIAISIVSPWHSGTIISSDSQRADQSTKPSNTSSVEPKNNNSTNIADRVTSGLALLKPGAVSGLSSINGRQAVGITKTKSAVSGLLVDAGSFTSVTGFKQASGAFELSGTTAIKLSGAPSPTAYGSLLQIASPLAKGNAAINGGTYIGLNAPQSGPGSAADLLNLQVSGITKLLVTNAGSLTINQLSVKSGGVVVYGGLRTDSLQLGTNAMDGYVLTSDTAGNATWQAPQVSKIYNNGVVKTTSTVIWTSKIVVDSDEETLYVTADSTPNGNALFTTTITSVQITGAGTSGIVGTVKSISADRKQIILNFVVPNTATAPNQTVKLLGLASNQAYITVMGD